MEPRERNGIGELAERVAGLEERLARVERLLEGRQEEVLHDRPSPQAVAVTRAPAAGVDDEPELLPLYGRTLLLFAGAFLIRALTEGGALPVLAGTWLGVVYALGLLAVAERTAASRRTSATFYGLAGVGIAFPLVWEATARFGFLSPRGGAVALALLAAAAIFVVARRRLHALAWLVAAGGCGAAVALALGTRDWGPYVLELLLMAAAFMAVAPRRGWWGLQGVTGSVAIAALALMTATLMSTPGERVAALYSPESLLLLQLLWVVLFFGLLAYRTLVAGEEVRAADATLALATLVVGFGGALMLTRQGLVSPSPLAVTSVALAAGGYAASFAFVDRRLSRINFAFYTTFALAVTLVAAETLLQGGALALVFVVLALATGMLGSLKGRATLTVHSAVYLLAALATSGGLGAIIDAFVGTVPPIAWLTAPTLAALAVALVDAVLPASVDGRTWGRFARVPRVVIDGLVLLAAGAIGVSVGLLVMPAAGEGPDVALVAALRSAAIAAIAVAAAWASRQPRWPEAAWLVYPLLVAGAVKLLLVDLPQGRPATLMLSFLVYGAALIVAPRMGRRSGQAAS